MNFFLLNKCRRYFKRELLLSLAGEEVGPRTNSCYAPDSANDSLPFDIPQVALRKLMPISVGISDDTRRQIEFNRTEKTVDVFFAGELDHSPHRREGARQIRELARRGYAVDIVENGLPKKEYLRRCAGAWLCWSPEGYGWDCFRHYEACACGSVPVVSRPPIRSYAPLQDGVHCFHYAKGGDNLNEVIVQALQNQDQLRRMAGAAREHVLRHHTHRELCRYIVESCFEADTVG